MLGSDSYRTAAEDRRPWEETRRKGAFARERIAGRPQKERHFSPGADPPQGGANRCCAISARPAIAPASLDSRTSSTSAFTYERDLLFKSRLVSGPAAAQ